VQQPVVKAAPVDIKSALNTLVAYQSFANRNFSAQNVDIYRSFMMSGV